MENIHDINDVYKEVLTFLAYFDEKLIQNIPSKVFKELNDKAADSTKDFFINPDKSLDEQNISEDAKNVLSLIYYQYIADKNNKEDIFKLWNNNEKN